MKKKTKPKSSYRVFDRKDPRYRFGERLKERMKEDHMSRQDLIDAIFDMTGRQISMLTVNSWRQHRSIPGNDLLIAICNIFPPYSKDYFLGITEAPNYDLEFIHDKTGLSSDAIDHLKKISRKHSHTLNAILESEYLDKLIVGIDEAEKNGTPDYEITALETVLKIREKQRSSAASNETDAHKKDSPEGLSDVYENARVYIFSETLNCKNVNQSKKKGAKEND
jgi:transcriptional regulator with XRE-family HTH domain